jgi:hypothetical protein
MGGFSAISAGNGWLIAAMGISVVFFGLASLAFIITYFPRSIRWWNDHAQTPKYTVELLRSLFSRRKTEATIRADTGEGHEPGGLDDGSSRWPSSEDWPGFTQPLIACL